MRTDPEVVFSLLYQLLLVLPSGMVETPRLQAKYGWRNGHRLCNADQQKKFQEIREEPRRALIERSAASSCRRRRTASAEP